MIVVKIKSGLGNQMFQYALARRLSLDWNDNLKYDLSWFDNIKSNETIRELEIDKFNIIMNKVSAEEVTESKGNIFFRWFIQLIEKIKGRINRNHFYKFYPSLLKKRKKIFLDGYYQSYKYFDSIRDILLHDFTLKNGYSPEALQIKNEIEQGGQSVSLHIRRGDYVSTCKDWNGLCSVEYYKKGIDLITNKYSNIKIFVFSDDIKWAKENLNFNHQTVFVSRPALNSVEELLLMSLCKHQIIANSTFSWWAAWLNKNTNKIVLAPSRWLLAAEIDTSDLIPKDWLKL